MRSLYVVFAVLCLAVSGWCTCRINTGYCSSRISVGNMQTRSCSDISIGDCSCKGSDLIIPMGTWSVYSGGSLKLRCPGDATWSTGYQSTADIETYCMTCTDSLEIDSIYCVREGYEWKDRKCSHVDDPEDCSDAECCAKFNEGNVPVDTGFVGCRSMSLTEGCTNTSISTATCNSTTVYSLCTRTAIWNKATSKCGWVQNNNCTEMLVHDDKCTDIQCYSYKRSEVANLALNRSTYCWEGRIREVTFVECSNGDRGEGSVGAWEDYKVCESYLDSLGMNISESEGGPVDFNINEYVQGDYEGGTSVDAEGNVVENSPGGRTGGTTTEEQEVVTRDSAGSTIPMKNSEGGDSTKVVSKFNEVICLGQSNGYATLTNGSSTWTCPANSCSQALMSYSIPQGACSPNATSLPGSNVYGNSGSGSAYVSDTSSRVDIGDSVIDYTKILQNIDKNIQIFYGSVGDPQRTNFYEALDAIKAVIENTTARQLHSDTLLASDIQGAVSSLGGKVDDVGTAISNNTTLVVGSLSSLGGKVDDVKTAVNNTAAAVNSNTSSVTGAVTSLGTKMTEVKTAVNDLGYDISFTLPNKIDSAMTVNFDAYYDKITPFITETVEGLGQIQDSMSVTVTIDTVEVHSSKLDSIADQLKKTFTQSADVHYDTLDLEDLYTSGQNSALVDTSETWVDTTDLYDGSFDDGGEVDSIETVLPAKLDSSISKGNVESDSAVARVKDKLMDVAGVDSGASAVKDLFTGYSGGCPRNCLRVNVQGVAVLPSMSIKFDSVLCDIELASGYTALDFIKVVLKLLTSIFCVMTVWRFFIDSGVGGKK